MEIGLPPKISVIIPIYNAEQHLQQALDSISRQTYKNIEIIALDDGSTDNSLEILKKHQVSDQRLIIVSRENRGLGATLNELISLSNSEYIARMDADDICHPDRLEKQIHHILNNPDCVIVGGQIEFLIGEEKIKALTMPTSHEEIRQELLKGRFPLCHPAILFKKSAAEKAGFYRISGAGEDLDFFLRITEIGNSYNLETTALSYRIQESSLSMRKSSELRRSYKYSLHCASLRNKGMPEISLNEFEKTIWSNRSSIQKAKDHIHQKSEILYRKSIIMAAHKKNKSAVFFLAAAASLRPKTSIYRALQIIKKKISK